MTEREASTTKEAAKDVKEVAEGLGIRKEIMCENDDNAEVKECYDHAMEKGLYDKVKVHNLKGTITRRGFCFERENFGP